MSNQPQAKKVFGKAKWILLILGFIAGIIFWGGIHTAAEQTQSLEFCISCHEMGPVYDEYRLTAHYENTSGVRAECPDCHVPKSWSGKMMRKIKASREIYHKVLGTIDTPEKFEQKRQVLAQRVWDEMEATDSRECRNCHSFESMKLSLQDRFPQRRHERAQREGRTCIDCHKGIAHKLP